MTQRKLVECDACGKTKAEGEVSARPWVQVRTAVGSNEEYQAIIEALQAGNPENAVTDSGDFCSLSCLANWASARYEMRMMDDGGS